MSHRQPISTFLGIAVGLMVAALLAPLALGLPPSPQLGDWNEDDTKLDGTAAGREAWRQQRKARWAWNCYNYAVNNKTTDANGDAVRAQPGKGQKWPGIGKNLTRAAMCTKILARAKRDGLKNVPWDVGDPIPKLRKGQNLVALGAVPGVKGEGADYHWWRLNGDGTWSHKRGSQKAKTTYTNAAMVEVAITDPREAAQRDGYSLCAFMSVNKDPEPDIGPLAAVTDCGPGEGRVVLSALVLSGYSDLEMQLDDIQVAQLFPALPTFAPGNEVPNPNWGGVPAGSAAGFEIFFDEAVPDKTLPMYLRAFQGVVEVLHFRPDLNAWGLFHYNDDQGLEPLLQDIFNPPSGACCDLNGDCELATRCTCDELGGAYQGDGIACEEVICPLPCPQDVNGDGTINVLDLIDLLLCFGLPAVPGCEAEDINGDGTVNVLDLIDLLLQFGQACP